MDSMECGGAGGGDDRRRPDSSAVEPSEECPRPALKRKAAEGTEGELEEDREVNPACVIEGSKHADGSIYRQDTHFCHRLYRLHDTRETLLKPTNLSHLDTTKCKPNWNFWRTHQGCAMMQIFSLKLANHSTISVSAGRIQLYGFMAVRDLLQPLRNYVFNRTRDDPLVLHPCPTDPSSPLLIQMAGPKRGIYLQARALIEFDMRIKRATEDEDLQLIDGAATFSELTPFHGVYTQRIHGDHGAAVDISLALLRQAVEARIQVGIPKVPANGISLSVACLISGLRQEIKFFDSIIDKPGALDNFVVAVIIRKPLILNFKVARPGQNACSRFFAFPGKAHGWNRHYIPLDFGTIEVQVSWTNLVN